MAQRSIRAVSGEYLEKGTESPSRYREFDNFSQSKQKILTLIADRMRAEAASVEYQKIAAQTVKRAKNKDSVLPPTINCRA